jgi:hypothetical protein
MEFREKPAKLMSVDKYLPRDGNVPRDAHPDIWLFVRYWQYIHPDGRMPGLSHLLLDDIPALCPHLRLIDVVDGGPYRYRVRMIGDEHKRQLGYDPSGSWYEKITSRFENSVVELDLARVCHKIQPVYRKGETIVPYVSDSKFIERVHVPLASDGLRVDGIASLTLFFPDVRTRIRSRASASRWLGSDDTSSASPIPLEEMEALIARMRAEASEARPSPD